ncbi:MAG: hypothetical protein ACTSRX_02365 [Promethearchaeota archaeon]
MENIDDVLPYLNLKDGEEILFVKQFEGGIFIKYLKKYHEPEKFPEHLIKIKKDCYEFDQFDIITNFRLIKFGINYNYMKEDNITPLSEIFHHENLFLWVNLEDIIDYKVNFKVDRDGHLGFKFFGKGRLNVKERPLNFFGYNYEEYCQVKDIVVKRLKFEPQEIDKEEDKNIQKIIKKNELISSVTFVGLVFLGWIIAFSTFPTDTQGPTVSFFQYSLFGLHVVYTLFFLVFNTITYGILIKKYQKKKFFTLMKLYYAWYQGPYYSGFFFTLGVAILMIEGFLLLFIDNGWLALSISFGFLTIVVVLSYVYESHSRKKKKQTKKNH